jgi:3-isopropylmalate/(R)-2-methylmalate dehydratase small subunit
MEEIKRGRAWKFGHDAQGDRDVFQFKYLSEEGVKGMTLELARHAMESVNPEFGTGIERNDFVVAGRNFGSGPSHRQGIQALKMLGVGAIIADSITKYYFKACVYYALPMLIGDGVSDKIKQGDNLEVRIDIGKIKNLTTNETFVATSAVPHGHRLFPIMEAGGQIPYLKKRVASR